MSPKGRNQNNKSETIGATATKTQSGGVSINLPTIKSSPRKQKKRRGKQAAVVYGPSMPRPTKRERDQSRDTVITGDEFIAGVNGSTVPVTTAYAVNPGQATTFPQLAVEAVLYEKWFSKELEFYYRPLGGPQATNNASGIVLLAWEADSSVPLPTNRPQVEAMRTKADCLPYEKTARVRLPSNRVNQTRSGQFVRPAGLPGSSDIKTYDAGNLIVMTDACPNTGSIGELRVRYTIRLAEKILRATTAKINNTVTVFRTPAGQASAATNVAALMTLAQTDTNGVGATNSAGTITLPAGNYLIDMFLAADNSGNNATQLVASLWKNGVNYPTGLANFPANYSTGTVSSCSVALGLWITVNGTDTIAMNYACQYGAGTVSLSGYLRITAI